LSFYSDTQHSTIVHLHGLNIRNLILLVLHKINKRKANWIGHIVRRNRLLRQLIEGNIKEGIEVTGRRGRRRRKLLDDLKERRRYSHLKEEALDRSMLRAHFGRGFGPVVRQTAKLMNSVRPNDAAHCDRSQTQETPINSFIFPVLRTVTCNSDTDSFCFIWYKN
jgi:hypothetical protein